MTLDDAMRAACDAAGIKPPSRMPVPGRWQRTDTLGKNGRGDASVMIFDNQAGGIAWNWQTQIKQPFRIDRADPVCAKPKIDYARKRREQEETAEAARISALIVAHADQSAHPYLERKGFADELALVHSMPHKHFPQTRLGKAMLSAMPEGEGPWLIVPGRIDRQITTVQFIGPDGVKKNILRGRMAGAACRVATGRETWVCEGIATAMTVRAALRLLGRSATVLSAFSASNAASIVKGLPGSMLATDNDKPIEAFGGLGTGEYYARKSGRAWIMPPEAGDWNDFHQAYGLRAVALKLREAG